MCFRKPSFIQLFALADHNGRGDLNPAMFGTAEGFLGMTLKKDAMYHYFSKADSDEDTTINLEKFVKSVSRIACDFNILSIAWQSIFGVLLLHTCQDPVFPV